ncbi:hypothetical protein EG832_01575 [bacterium]|nr:hypothetical protein [bacterium]
MASEANIKQLMDMITACIEKPIDDLVSNPNWGTINFEEARPELERFFSILNHLKVLPVGLLPDQAINTIIEQGKPVYTIVDSIKQFAIEQANPLEQRNRLVTQLKPAVDNFYTHSHLWIPFLAYQRGDIQRNIQELNKTVDESSKLLTAAKTDVKKKQGEIDQIITAAREASATVGVGHFTADFLAESTSQGKSAKKWLVATGVVAGLTLLAAGASMFYHPSLETSQLIQMTSSKLILLGLLFTATVWCGKLYKAAKHLEAVNKHRSNALKTFQAFTNAANDTSMKDAVLMETTKSIFALTQTGYLDSDGGHSDSGVKVVEVVKNGAQTLAAASKAAS